MFPTSIRHRLPLSYGAVALLATLFLGMTLVTSLSRFYHNQEQAYLEKNAQVIAAVIGRLDLTSSSGSPADHLQLLQTQINTFSFVTQVQIQVFDEEHQLLADSGNPQALEATSTLSLQVNVDDQQQSFSQTIDTQNEGVRSVIEIVSGGQRIESETSITGSNIDELILQEGEIPLSLLETPFTFGPGVAAESDTRSTAIHQVPIWDAESELIGFLELSEGPAFGRSILSDVITGLILAAILATILATAAGWWMSTRLSRPIQALAQTTKQMATGDLSVRTNIARKDELGQLADSFNEMAGQIEGTVSTLRHFVADAAHELNTPLTALRTNLELAARQTPQNEHLQEAQQQADRLERLNDDLLRLSRLESGLSDDEFHPVDMTDLLRENTERFAAQAEQADINFSISLPQHIVSVAGNEEQLRRVVDNLVDNAFKFTPTTGHVGLSLATNGNWATLVVEDSGIGIREEDLPFVFHRFHRGRNTADYPGSGLGLAMVKAIVDNHQGYVTISSRPDQGTRISMRLPVQPRQNVSPSEL